MEYFSDLDFGIIPADAGSTIGWRYVNPSTQDHPRGCEEHIQRRRSSICAGGSSPRMRGAPFRAAYI